MKIYVGADHRGFHLKEEIKELLLKQGREVVDVGNHEYDQGDDFPDFASSLAGQVVEDTQNRGILFCGSGAGVSVTANKFKGSRACIGLSPKQVQAARGDDDLNILVIAADFLNRDWVEEMVEVFLSTEFKGEERHMRRLEKIKQIEANK